MNKARTKEQIIASGYIRMAELKRIYGSSTGNRLYKAAQEIDTNELGTDRVITNMVRIDSVCAVIGIKKRRDLGSAPPWLK